MGIPVIVLLLFGLIMMAFLCMMGICGPYITYDMLMLSIAIGKF